MRKYVLAFLGLALLLTACRIESNIILDINEDGSATVGAEVGFDEEMLDLMSQSGGDPSDILGELPDLGGDGVEPIQRTEGDMTFYGATTHVDDLSTYDFDGLQGESFSEFVYEYDDSSATLAAKVDATGIGDLGGGDLPIDPSEITADIFAAHVRISMPGTVTEHNADEVTGDGTLIWNLPLTGTKAIFATSTFGSTAPSWIWFVVGGIVIVGIAAAIAAVMKSRKESQDAVAAAAAAAQPPAEEQQSPDSSQPSAEEPEASVSEDEPSPDETSEREPPSDDNVPPDEVGDDDGHPADEDGPDS
jgi:hypothetical protein